MPNGIISAGFQFFANPRDSTDGISRTDPAGFHQAFYAVSPKRGSHTENLVPLRSRTTGGYKMRTYVDDYYNRVHFTPSQINYGSIAQDVERTVAVWNAHFQTNTLDVLTIDPSIGVTYTLGPAIPASFGKLEEITLGFTAALSGVSEFDSLVNFDFALKDPYDYRVVGSRSLLKKDGPNWRAAMIENIEFNTEIVNRSRSGKEQRRALRSEPRRDFGFLYTARDAKSRREFQALLTRWRRRTALIPLYPYIARTTAATTAGQFVLQFATLPPWALPDQNVLISHGTMSGDVIGIIQSVDSGTNSVTLFAGVSEDVPVNAAVRPVMTSRLNDGMSVQRFTAEVEEATLTYKQVPGLDPAYTPPAATEFLNGYEVFLIDPNWGTPIQQQWDMPLEEVDTGYGVKSYFEYQNFVQFTQRFLYTGLRDTKVQAIKDLFYRQMGQLGEFWMPSHGNDLMPDYDLADTSTSFRIKGTEFYEEWYEQTTIGALIIYLKDGTHLTRIVSSIGTVIDGNGEDTVVTVASPWVGTISKDDILKCQWLTRARFATDTLQIEWVTDSAANVQFAIRSLEAL